MDPALIRTEEGKSCPSLRSSLSYFNSIAMPDAMLHAASTWAQRLSGTQHCQGGYGSDSTAGSCAPTCNWHHTAARPLLGARCRTCTTSPDAEWVSCPYKVQTVDGPTSAPRAHSTFLCWPAGPLCGVKVRPTLPIYYSPITKLPSKLHLAGMQLIYKNGFQIPASGISASLSSTLQPFDASRCNPGSSSARGNPRLCHTALEDPNPSITFEYPCFFGLTQVHVANNADINEG